MAKVANERDEIVRITADSLFFKKKSYQSLLNDGGRTKEGSQTGLDFQHTIGVPLPSYRNGREREVHIKLSLRRNNSDAV